MAVLLKIFGMCYRYCHALPVTALGHLLIDLCDIHLRATFTPCRRRVHSAYTLLSLSAYASLLSLPCVASISSGMMHAG